MEDSVRCAGQVNVDMGPQGTRSLLSGHVLGCHLLKRPVLTLVGPERRGRRPLSSRRKESSPFCSRSSWSKRWLRSWLKVARQRGARAMCSLISKGANFPQEPARVCKGTRGMAPVAAGQARLLCESQQRHEGGRQAKGEPSPLGKCEVSTGREPGLSLSDGPRCGGTAATVSTCSASLPQACLRSATQRAPLAT